MAKARMRDVVIVLPGITGSVLEKDGRDVWAATPLAVHRALASAGAGLESLRLEGDDPEADDLGDGIRATRLLHEAHLVPGLVKIDGYTGIRRLILQHFDVTVGHPDDLRPANYYEFAYDWRRDNRAAAEQLRQRVCEWLPRWRDHSGAADAKVILLAHSMGGLVARHYVEVLEGWKHCRALITFGTPHRGAVSALTYLVNGYRKLFVDLTEVLRSFTSIYQLLPIYPMITAGGGLLRPAEVDALVNPHTQHHGPTEPATRIKDALDFHRRIEEKATARLAQTGPGSGGVTLAVVGTHQPTPQAATLTNDRLTTARQPPAGIDVLLGGGDGTVPRVSAIPIELSDAHQCLYVAERHSALHNCPPVLDDLRGRLEQLQARGLGAIRGVRPDLAPGGRGVLALDLEDAYRAAEPVELRVRAAELRRDPGGLLARIHKLDPPTATQQAVMEPHGDGWRLEVRLPPGLYRVAVESYDAAPGAPGRVHDLFEVLP